MSCAIALRTLSGAGVDDGVCLLLEVDECRILLDCGWDCRFDPACLEPLRAAIQERPIDAVLVSHGDLGHMGGLPYAVAKLGLDCPVYATMPAWRLGQLSFYELFQARNSRSSFAADVFDLDDVDRAFARMNPLKFAQETRLSGAAEGVVVTPLPAGHSLGGAIWRITKETDEVVYAVDMNHRKELHLDPAVLDTSFNRPSVLITDCIGAPMTYIPRRSREERLLEAIMSTLRNDGNVLIPCDLAGRTLELLVMLDKHWGSQKLGATYNLALLTYQGFNALDYAKSFLEWLSEHTQKMFNENRENPFQLPCVNLIYNVSDLDELAAQRPTLVLATTSFMEQSHAEDVLLRWAHDPANLVVFTQTPAAGSLARKVFDKTTYREPEYSFMYTHKFNVPLEGQELQAYREKRRLEQQQEALEEEVSSDEDVDVNMQDGQEGGSMFKKVLRLAPAYPMFIGNPKDREAAVDDYGEALHAHEFVVEEEEADDIAMEGVRETPVEEEHDEEALWPPSKEVAEELKVDLDCAVTYIGFEGRVDGRSMRTILERVAPRRLVLVRGTDKGKEMIRRHCDQAKIASSTFVPETGENVSLTSDTTTIKVKLKETLLKTLQFVPVVPQGTQDAFEVAFVEGRLNRDTGATAVLEHMGQKGHRAVYLGDVTLPRVRQTLLDSGIDAEFVGGTLVCQDGLVNIQKVSDTVLSVHGGLSPHYYRIRHLLYNHYHIV